MSSQEELDRLDGVATEAEPTAPVYEVTIHGRMWSFGRPDVRPAALRRYSALAQQLENSTDVSGPEAIELGAFAEDLVRSALPDAASREAFDNAAFTGTQITELCAKYFAALGAEAGESSASPAPSPSTVARSRPTSKRTTGSP